MSLKEDLVLHASEVWQEYENGIAYQDKLSLTKNLKLYREFFEGKQWANPTKRTQHLPRPVFNVCSLIVENKVANVLGSPVKLNFMGEYEEDTSKMTRFAEWQQKEMEQEELDSQACENGAVEGTWCYHYFWDETATGRHGEYEGALRGQIISPLNFIVANPRETDCQKQKYIILVSREEVRAVKDMCESEEIANLILADDEDQTYDGTNIEQEAKDDSKLCTVLLRYFRKDGEVYFEKVTKQTALYKARPLNPLLNEKILLQEDDLDAEVTETPDMEYDEDNMPKASLYPIEINSWKSRNNCIYGRGEIEEIIPNQKAINFLGAMQLLNQQELGWGKILVKQNALHGQVIDNTPGQVIVDYSTGNGWGITRLEGSQMTAGTINLLSQVVELTRTCNNASEVLTGEILSRDLSGTAIQQITAQAQKPIAKLQRAFWRSKARIGKILEMFYKLFYENTDFSYELKADEQQALNEELKAKGRKDRVQKTQFDVFNGRDMLEKKFSVAVCEAGAGSRYSEIMAMDTLNTLFINGNIDRMTTERLEQFITLYPDSAMPFKAELRAIINSQKQSELGQYKSAYENINAQLQQVQSYSKSQEEVITKLEKQIANYEKALNDTKNSYEEKLKNSNQLLGKMFEEQYKQKISQEQNKQNTNNKKSNVQQQEDMGNSLQ